MAAASAIAVGVSARRSGVAACWSRPDVPAPCASTVSWPVTHLLIERVGWTGTYLVYAALLACVAAPLHALALPRSRFEADVPLQDGQKERVKTLPTHGLPFILVASAFASYAFAPSGLSAHLLAIFGRSGIDAGTVVWIGALFGPAQVGARLIEFTFGRDLHPLWVVRFALSSLLCAFVMLALLGVSTGTGAPMASSRLPAARSRSRCSVRPATAV